MKNNTLSFTLNIKNKNENTISVITNTIENRKKNTPSIDDVINEHGEFVMKFIGKRTWDDQSVEDIFQSTMLQAIKSYKNFRGESHPRTWLCGIAFNMIRNHAKTLNIPSFEPIETIKDCTRIAEHSRYGTEDPCDTYARNTRFEYLYTIYDELPHDMKITFNEVVNRGKSYEEAATLLNLPIGTVRSRISRAREIFRERSVHH